MPPAFHFAGAEVLPGSGLGNRSSLRSSRSAPAGACPVCGRSIDLLNVVGSQLLHLPFPDIGHDKVLHHRHGLGVGLRGPFVFGGLDRDPLVQHFLYRHGIFNCWDGLPQKSSRVNKKLRKCVAFGKA